MVTLPYFQLVRTPQRKCMQHPQRPTLGHIDFPNRVTRAGGKVYSDTTAGENIDMGKALVLN